MRARFAIYIFIDVLVPEVKPCGLIQGYFDKELLGAITLDMCPSERSEYQRMLDNRIQTMIYQ